MMVNSISLTIIKYNRVLCKGAVKDVKLKLIMLGVSDVVAKEWA